jgi:hypothetical protein
MFLNLLLLPLIIIILISLFGRFLSYKGIYKLILIMMIELLIISIILNYDIFINNSNIEINLFINFGLLNFN